MTRRPVLPHRLRLLAAGTVAALAGAALVVTPAHAATFGPVSTETELLDAIDDANGTSGADVIVLASGATIVTMQRLTINESVTLDLNGGSLTTGGILVNDTSAVTITGGTLISDASGGGDSAAGIGVASLASVTISNATVTATGSSCDAGIGGVTASGDDACTSGPPIPPGSITIIDSTVTATGGTNAAGIGGGFDTSAAPIAITNSTVTATGGSNGAGIGGGSAGGGGTIVIVSSTVTAQGGFASAGIGGGAQGQGGAITVLDSVVDARGGLDGAGIGGGEDSAGAILAVTDSTIFARGENTAGIGPGNGAPAGTIRSTTFAGIGEVESNGITGTIEFVADSEYTVPATTDFRFSGPFTNDGTIVANGNFEVPENETLVNNGQLNGGGLLRGEGTVENNGSICIQQVSDASLSVADPPVGLTITGNAFYLPYRYPAGFTVGNVVYAPTMDDGCRGFPQVSEAPSGDDPGFIVVGWTLTEDGSGPFVSTSTPLIDVAPTGQGTFYPTLVEPAITVTPSATTVSAGDVVALAVEGPLEGSNELVSDLTDFVAFGDVGQDFGDDAGELSFTEAGVYTVPITMTYFLGFFSSFDVTTEAVITVEPAALDSLTVTPSASTISEGGTIELSVSGEDAFGNSVAIDPDDVTVTSSVATDIIDGLTVTFPTASPHVLTVTVGDVSAEVTIEVTPAATGGGTGDDDDSELVATGANDPALIGMLALLLLVLGAVGAVAPRLRLSRTR